MTKLSAFGTEATPSVGDERIPMAVDLAGTPADRYIKIGDIVYSSATAPTSPEDNFLWHETDTGIVWRYGTYASSSRWVSAGLKDTVAGTVNSPLAADTIWAADMNPLCGYDIYVDTFYAKVLVLTTNGATHHWELDLRKVSGSTVPAAATGTLLGSGLDTTAISADAWSELSESIDEVVDGTGSGLEFMFIDIDKNNSPGNMWYAVGYSYRLVHP